MIKTVREYAPDHFEPWQPATRIDQLMLHRLYYGCATESALKASCSRPEGTTIRMGGQRVEGSIGLRFIIEATDSSVFNSVWGLFIVKNSGRIAQFGNYTTYPIRFEVARIPPPSRGPAGTVEFKNHQLLWCDDHDEHAGIINARPR
jgi:hypothetical protein